MRIDYKSEYTSPAAKILNRNDLELEASQTETCCLQRWKITEENHRPGFPMTMIRPWGGEGQGPDVTMARL